MRKSILSLMLIGGVLFAQTTSASTINKGGKKSNRTAKSLKKSTKYAFVVDDEEALGGGKAKKDGSCKNGSGNCSPKSNEE